MVFTHDTDMTLMHAAALANTGPALGDEDREELPDLAALLALDGPLGVDRAPAHEPGRGGCRARPAPAAARDLGSRRGRRWSTRRTPCSRRAGRSPGWCGTGRSGGTCTPRRDDAPLARRIAVEVGMALVDVIRAGETDRLKVCAGDDCEDLLIDLSKNRSRKFCDGTCGTRANVAAYRARTAPVRRSEHRPGRRASGQAERWSRTTLAG